MPTEVSGTTPSQPSGAIKGPQSFFAGLALVALALFALWATKDLSQGTLRQMGPAMLPRFLAICVGICGVALAVAGVLKPGDVLERWTLRGPALVMLGIFAFSATIRPMEIGPLTTPGLGLAIAGPLAIIIGGFATPEVRIRELVILGLALTAFCMVLFGDLLNLPIPTMPQWLSDRFPASISNDNRLRIVAAVMAAGAFLLFLVGLGGRRKPIDVTDHSGQI